MNFNEEGRDVIRVCAELYIVFDFEVARNFVKKCVTSASRVVRTADFVWKSIVWCFFFNFHVFEEDFHRDIGIFTCCVQYRKNDKRIKRIGDSGFNVATCF